MNTKLLLQISLSDLLYSQSRLFRNETKKILFFYFESILSKQLINWNQNFIQYLVDEIRYV